MTVLDYILDGLEAELALERELGVRSLEIDRPFIVENASRPQRATRIESRPETSTPPSFEPLPEPIRAVQPTSSGVEVRFEATLPLTFLHHRELGPQETEMMSKIVEALGFNFTTAPIVYEKPIPKAKFYVVLGRRALAKFLPNEHRAFNTWFTTGNGVSMLFTRAPSDILRFKDVTPQLMKIKADMWRSLKAVAEKIKTLEGEERDVE